MRKEILKKVKRIVIKIGSRVVTTPDYCLDKRVINHLATEVAALRARNLEIIIVSSGAVAAGRKDLGISDRPRTIPQKQAAAAVGQFQLMHSYEEAFAPHGHKVAQLLLTGDDLADRQRFLNARATLDTLLECGIIPIINENDTVAVDEIKFGDNDNLSALVTNLAEAHLLVILTDIAGLYDKDPRTCPDGCLISLVRSITRDLENAAGGTGSSVGTGGMATKLTAAKKVVKSGVPAIIMDGRGDGLLSKAMAGDDIGTMFLPDSKVINRKKHWIAYTLRPKGKVTVDGGAAQVLHQQGRSLLPSGVTAVDGVFERGACVRVCDDDGTEFARGITDYSNQEIAAILGHRSSEIEKILGYRYSDEIIHRDNLVIL